MEQHIDDIAAAIKNKNRIAFTYKHERRTVEPQCLGMDEKGVTKLRAYEIFPESFVNKLFIIDSTDFDHLSITVDHFDTPGPHYKRNDSAMKGGIIAQL
jgi:hypothetical protein